jgi:muconolactone delta-isomerase
MNLSVLHVVKSPDRDYTMKDKLNGITGPLGCRFLEWSGWYNQNISQRLLGHYRLYQLFKAKRHVDFQVSLPAAYIAHYRTLHIIKYALSCITAALYYICTLGGRYHPLLIEQLNRQMIFQQFTILQEFLTNADTDFEKALFNAIDQINGNDNQVIPEITLIQNRLEQKVYNNTCHYFTEYNGTTLSSSNQLKGKQPGVLTKRQILILLDLLADKKCIERIDYKKSNKFKDEAELLHALNGKSKSTWEEELKDYNNKGIYHYNGEGELNQLIKDLTSLSNIIRKSAFRPLVNAVVKKIKELELIKRANGW